MDILEQRLGLLEKEGLSCCGVSFAQCYAIVQIGRRGKMSLNNLAQVLSLDNSTMSRTVNNLVNKQLAVREIDPEDRRFVTIRLTESGQGLYQQIETGMNNYFQKISELVPEEKRHQVLESVQILLSAMDKNCCCNSVQK